jgi:thiamine biosynthesis lipoprotein
MSTHKISTPAWRPNRREMFLFGLGGLVAAVPFARRKPLALVQREFAVMGTIGRIAVAHRDPQRVQAAIDAAVEALRWVDRTMTNFSALSDVGRANLRAAQEAVTISPETADVLIAAQSWAETSDGTFDPCVGRSIELWDVKHRHDPPPARDVARLANRTLYQQLEIGRRLGMPVVRFHDADVNIDLGGIAKGYGVDRAVAALREHGVEHALVAAGGDIYALGRSPSGEPWQIGIQSPFDKGALVGSLPFENAAISTSGDYEQFFLYGGRRYHHIVDPTTGAPGQTAIRSVTVVAGTNMAADAGATLAFALSGGGQEILAKHGAHIAHMI